jgi:hypothetical protein
MKTAGNKPNKISKQENKKNRAEVRDDLDHHHRKLVNNKNETVSRSQQKRMRDQE